MRDLYRNLLAYFEQQVKIRSRFFIDLFSNNVRVNTRNSVCDCVAKRIQLRERQCETRN